MILCFYKFFMFFSVIAFVSQCLHKCPTELWHRCRILAEELAELSLDQTLMISFTQKALASSWLGVVDEYPLLSQKATKILLPFSTT